MSHGVRYEELRDRAWEENTRLIAVIRTARDNIGSLMAAYPERFPRHAFQGTYDLLNGELSQEQGTPTRDTVTGCEAGSSPPIFNK